MKRKRLKSIEKKVEEYRKKKYLTPKDVSTLLDLSIHLLDDLNKQLTDITRKLEGL